MGIICSTEKLTKRIQNSKKWQQQPPVFHYQKAKIINNQRNDAAKPITITDQPSFFLERLDKINKSQKSMKPSPLTSVFEKQQQLLEWKLDCDIVFIIDLRLKTNNKRLKLLKELLSQKDRHQSKFGIVYFGNRKTQFDLIDQSLETTYDLQKQLQTLKLDDWICVIKSLREQISREREKQYSQIYILSDQRINNLDESILEIVDNVLEITKQRNSLAFECHSYKVDDEDSEKSLELSSNEMQFSDQLY